MQQMNNITQPPDPAQNYLGFQPANPKPQGEGWRSILSTVLLLLAAPLIALFLINFVFQSYEVDGPSMESTLYDQDRLIVLKTGKTWARATGGSFIPKRGDIVIFNKTRLGQFNGAEKQLIKRVIGLPGERVVVKDGSITVYNREFPGGFNPDKQADYGDAILSTSGNLDITVPKNHIFVSGDNRGNSLDSRDFGTVPAADVVGTLALRIFPLNKLEAF